VAALAAPGARTRRGAGPPDGLDLGFDDLGGALTLLGLVLFCVFVLPFLLALALLVSELLLLLALLPVFVPARTLVGLPGVVQGGPPLPVVR
jgi:hypothetical protein